MSRTKLFKYVVALVLTTASAWGISSGPSITSGDNQSVGTTRSGPAIPMSPGGAGVAGGISGGVSLAGTPAVCLETRLAAHKNWHNLYFSRNFRGIDVTQ